MAVPVQLRNPTTGDETVAYKGYSWTSLFFGGIPALIRGDIKLGLMVIGATIVGGIAVLFIGLQTWVSTAIIGAVWGFYYNEISLNRKMRDGYAVWDGPPPAA